MKKTREWKRKNYLKRLAIREVKKRLRRKRNLKKKNKKVKLKIHKAKNLKLIAPKNFSFIRNTDEILSYFKEAHSAFLRGQRVLFSLSEVRQMTPDTIALMIALLQDENYLKGGRFEGNAPSDTQLNEMFVKSNFYRFFNSGMPDKKYEESEIQKLATNNQPDSAHLVKICSQATEHTMGEVIKLHPLYEILSECITNTYEHADPNTKGAHSWWLFLYKDPHTKVSHITILDLGVGIFKSMLSKPFYKRMIDSLKGDNLAKLKILLSKGYSRIGEGRRGMGWPFIHDKVKEVSSINDFTLISNDIYANLSNGEFRKLNTKFKGTFIYCTLNPDQ